MKFQTPGSGPKSGCDLENNTRRTAIQMRQTIKRVCEKTKMSHEESIEQATEEHLDEYDYE